MNRWMTLMKWIAVVDMAYLCFLCTEDAICRVKDWLKKKKGKKPGDVELEFYDFQEETEEHKLCVDSIRMRYSVTVPDLVDKIFERSESVLKWLNEPEKEAARLLLSAYVGFLREESPYEEQGFPVLMELLNHTGTGGEGAESDIAGEVLEKAAKENQKEEYYRDYQKYKVSTVDRERVILACRVMVNELLAKLYEYDYHCGYDLFLNKSVLMKLKEEDEDWYLNGFNIWDTESDAAEETEVE